ncbi:MAG TPA: ATP synthase subunit I [Caulobacteraceae bacterium]|nr:ATP synthase subunit I [Caulobacteraceae bacterium]
MTAGDIERLAAFGLAGLILGGASMASLRLNTDLYVRGRLWRPIGLHFLRLSIMAGVLVWTAFQGAGPLLAVAGGLVLARPIAVRMLGRAS